ncbi:MutS-related protein [Gordonia sp. (in: high G+C Gram-positive bacteria)]|uniref:MutS-related protein n=1 Tax=Gordonia sp. (in: high G+C Gram-positive bacteria) TaxID=84139 RepID=UPI0039E6A86E
MATESQTLQPQILSARADGPSVLFVHPGDENDRGEPACFHDLNLRAVVDAVVLADDPHGLRPLFHQTVDPDTIALRHEVFDDFDRLEGVRTAVEAFHRGMDEIAVLRERALSCDNRLERMGWHLCVCRRYAETVQRFATDLSAADARSAALRALSDHLERLVAGAGFTGLRLSLDEVTAALGTVRYCVHIHKDTVGVRRYSDEPAISVETSAVLAPFTSGLAPIEFSYAGDARLNHVETQILDRVGRLFPDAFERLNRFTAQTADVIDPTVAAVDRELRFYTAYRAFLGRVAGPGLRFCYPGIVPDRGSATWVDDAFDLALALSRVDAPETVGPVVCNGFRLDPPERAIVVSGPNQGGKTTFARMFGQVHHLAALGVPIPGSGAQLFAVDEVYTHFEREEDATSGHGKLADELMRIHDVLDKVTDRSLVVMNESFTSTSLHDARLLGRTVLGRLVDAGVLCLYVTFVEELSRLSPATVSMVSAVDPHDPARRTFRVTRRPADGRAYARAIAEKYALTREDVTRRARS